MAWTVNIKSKVVKRLTKLPVNVRRRLILLMQEIEALGPVRGEWPNYGKLGCNRHHCHLKKGNPTYVAVWEEIRGEIKLIEVTYIGTHEKAPY